MRNIIDNAPLKPIEPTGFQGAIVSLNIAESILRMMIAKKIEVTIAENDEDWKFTFVDSFDGTKKMAVF